MTDFAWGLVVIAMVVSTVLEWAWRSRRWLNHRRALAAQCVYVATLVALVGRAAYGLVP